MDTLRCPYCGAEQNLEMHWPVVHSRRLSCVQGRLRVHSPASCLDTEQWEGIDPQAYCGTCHKSWAPDPSLWGDAEWPLDAAPEAARTPLLLEDLLHKMYADTVSRLALESLVQADPEALEDLVFESLDHRLVSLTLNCTENTERWSTALDPREPVTDEQRAFFALRQDVLEELLRINEYTASLLSDCEEQWGA